MHGGFSKQQIIIEATQEKLEREAPVAK